MQDGLFSLDLDEREARLQAFIDGEDLPTPRELDELCAALEIDRDEMLALCLFDEFGVLERKWQVSPEQIMRCAMLYPGVRRNESEATS